MQLGGKVTFFTFSSNIYRWSLGFRWYFIVVDDVNSEKVHVGHIEIVDWYIHRVSKGFEATEVCVSVMFLRRIRTIEFRHVDEELEGHTPDFTLGKYEMDRVTVTFLVERYRVITSHCHEWLESVVVWDGETV